MFLDILLPDVLRQLMIARMVPAWRHNQVQEFIFYPGSTSDIFHQVIEFTEVYIEEISSIDVPRNTILDLDVILFGLVSFEDAVPDVKQVAEVGVHV